MYNQKEITGSMQTIPSFQMHVNQPQEAALLAQ